MRWNLTTYTITYTGLPENVTNPNPTTYTLADLPIKLKKVTNEGTLYSWQILENDNQNVVFPTFPHPNDSILEGTHGNITVTVKAVAISNVTLVEGTEINSILHDWDEATSFRKNDTEPDNENSLNHIGGTYPNMQIPVWYDSETKTIWYYAPEGAVLYMNADSSQMFSQMNKLEIIDLSDFDTSNVTNMSKMFYNCSSLTTLDVSNWNTSNVTNMEYMFCDCRKLAELDVSNFDTSNVTNMVRMFQNCSELTALDVSKFETGNVTNMSTMFCGCTNLAELDVSSFDTSKVTNMDFMFSGCNNLAKLDVSSFDTSKVTNMSWMFNDCLSLTSLDVSEWNTSNVTSMDYMFYGCRALTTIYVTSVTDWSTSETLASSSCMFLSCYKLVGGSDTVYNASKTDKTYARTDGGTDSDSPGYFTAKE